MFIRYICNNCGQKCKSAEEYAGLKVNCSRCTLPLEIPILASTVDVHDTSPELLLAAASQAELHLEKIEQAPVQTLIPEKLPEPVMKSNKQPVQQPENKPSESSADFNNATSLDVKPDCIHGILFQIANKKGLLLHWLKRKTISHLKQEGGDVKIKEKWYRPTPGLVSFSLAVICITIILIGAFRKSSVTTANGHNVSYSASRTAAGMSAVEASSTPVDGKAYSGRTYGGTMTASIDVGGQIIVIPAPAGQEYIGTTHISNNPKEDRFRALDIYAPKKNHTMLAIFAPPEEAQKAKDQNYVPRLGATVQVPTALPVNPTLEDYQTYRQRIVGSLNYRGYEWGDWESPEFICKCLGGPVYFSWMSSEFQSSLWPCPDSARKPKEYWYQVRTTSVIYIKGRILYLRLYASSTVKKGRGGINPDDYREAGVKWLATIYEANGEQVD